MRFMRLVTFSFLVMASAAHAQTQRMVDAEAPIPTPEAFFGHPMGADRELVRWDRLVEYYEMIGAASDRIEVRNVGPSTLGHPFLVVFGIAIVCAVAAVITASRTPASRPRAA